MIYALGFYWIVAGFVMTDIVTTKHPYTEGMGAAVMILTAFIIGGFTLPARLLVKVVR